MFAAEVQYDTLTRSLLIALVLVAPYGVYKVRQVRASRARLDAAANGDGSDADAPGPSRPRLEDVIDAIDRLGRAEDGSTTITVPVDVTVGGDDPPPGLVDTLVRDALRRSSLAATAEIDTPGGRVIEVRRAAR